MQASISNDRLYEEFSGENFGKMGQKPKSAPRLFHPSLSKIPLQVRFGIAGLLSNVIFMILFNGAVSKLEHMYAASSIYSVVYFFFIPLSHSLTCGLVFGWPEKYVQSLASNYPIGLTAILIGAACTAYLDRIGFNEMVEDFIRAHLTFAHIDEVATDEDEKGEFYSSLLVLMITSIWSYVLSVMVNTPSESVDDKKEL